MLRRLLLALTALVAVVALSGAPASAQADDDERSERPAGTTLESTQRDDGSTSVAPWVIGSGIAALVVIGLGGTILQRRAG